MCYTDSKKPYAQALVGEDLSPTQEPGKRGNIHICGEYVCVSLTVLIKVASCPGSCGEELSSHARKSLGNEATFKCVGEKLFANFVAGNFLYIYKSDLPVLYRRGVRVCICR